MMLSRTGWGETSLAVAFQTVEGRRAPWGCAAGAPYRGTASPPPPPPEVELCPTSTHALLPGLMTVGLQLLSWHPNRHQKARKEKQLICPSMGLHYPQQRKGKTRYLKAQGVCLWLLCSSTLIGASSHDCIGYRNNHLIPSISESHLPAPQFAEPQGGLALLQGFEC